MAFPFSSLQRRVFRSRSEWWRSSNGWGEAMGSQGFQLRQLWYRNDHVICCANFWRLGGVSILSRFFKPCKFITYTSILMNQIYFLILINSSVNEDMCHTHVQRTFTANARSYNVAENAFLYRRHLFSKFVFCSYKSKINATLYNATSWYSLFNFFSFCLATTMKVIVLKIEHSDPSSN